MAGDGKQRTSDAKLAGWMRGANEAQLGVEASLKNFYAYCELGRFDLASAAAERATAYMEAHCDGVMNVQRALREK